MNVELQLTEQQSQTHKLKALSSFRLFLLKMALPQALLYQCQFSQM